MWEKKGLLFNVDGTKNWARSYASVPVADKLENNIYRIYYSPRNEQNHSSVGFFDIDINNPKKFLFESPEPLLSPGKLGTFDDTGIITTSVVNVKQKKYLYYVGWNQPKTVPFRWSIGLAISEDNGNTFRKFSEGPIMDRNIIDPYFVSSPTVILDDGLFRMYYISGLEWKIIRGEMRIPYHIRYAESEDGINWKRKGKVAIDFKNEFEIKVARASVFKEDGIYKMYFCYAVDDYRIGYAESEDGINWKRKDELTGIDVSEEGWDSESIEYPHIINHNGMKILLYNGNTYGKTGIGYAEWEY